MEVQKVSMMEKHGVAILLYGVAGSGKTHLAAQFPNFLFLDGGKGLLTLQALGKEGGYMKPENYDELLDCISLIDSYPQHEYGTLIIDDVSTLANKMLEWQVRAKGRSETPTIVDFGLIIARIRTNILSHLEAWRRSFRWIIFTTVIASIQNPETGAFTGAPALIGKKLPDEVPCLFVEVWRLEATTDGMGKVARSVCTVPEGFFSAETHLGLPTRLSPEELIGMLLTTKEAPSEEPVKQ